MQPLRIFVGYDSKEIVAYHTFCQSVIDHASQPVSFTPIALSHLERTFTRERNPLQSTEFSFSRFLTPYLSNYEGWSLFVDCDIILRDDVAKLFALADDRYAVMCCKHDYMPSAGIKFLNNVQTVYAKKNWSSVMLFNNQRCRRLDTDYVNSASGLELHQFKWLQSDQEIGGLPLEWNWLIGEYEAKDTARAVHFTVGGPYFDEFATCDFADEWRCIRDRVISVAQRVESKKS
ncbi:MAG: hypothetical protein RL543_1529 [Pseudomonadota bacterium]|jgi:hypothetical protein